MKRILTGMVAVLAGAFTVQGQGAVSFGNYGDLTNYINVLGGVVGLGESNTGPAATEFNFSVETTNGSDWTVALYGAAGSNLPASSLALLRTADGQPVTATLADGVIDAVAGTWVSQAVGIVPDTFNGQTATVQIYAWYNAGGLYTSYDAAAAAYEYDPYAPIEASATANVVVGDPSTPAPLPSGIGPGQLGNIIFPNVPSDGYTVSLNTDNTLTITGYAGGIGGSITIPTNINGYTVTAIGEVAFDNFVRNGSLTDVTIPDTVTTIEGGAFNESGILYISIGSGVTNVATFALGFNFLNEITVNPSNSVYSSINGVLFNKDKTVLLQYPGGLRGSYTVPSSVTAIGDQAFAYSIYLNNIYFQSNAPIADSSVFQTGKTAYYLPGTTGWDVFTASTGVPAVLWNPTIQTSGSNFGIQNDLFGFNITGTTNIPIAVEVCTNLANSVWTELQSLVLTTGSYYFTDPQWANYPTRLYRISAP